MKSEAFYTNALLTEMRKEGDPEADKFIAGCFSNASAPENFYSFFNSLQSNADLFASSRYREEELVMHSLSLPDWAEPGLIKKGISFFQQHRSHIMRLLGLLSLPYCYAAADGAMVLYLSERMRNDTGKRLKDTAKFVTDVHSAGAFEATGEALQVF